MLCCFRELFTELTSQVLLIHGVEDYHESTMACHKAQYIPQIVPVLEFLHTSRATNLVYIRDPQFSPIEGSVSYFLISQYFYLLRMQVLDQ